MPRFFGTPWAGVTVDVVVRFLADAADEGLIWEAKGHVEPHRDAVRKAVCGLANAQGGFLIIGAEREKKAPWKLPGVLFRDAEPATWLSSVIAEGVSPVPSFDIKVFDRGDSKSAAVVAVEPVALAPCMTASGVVFQRVTGQTLPVTDQRVLAELFARGRTAREQTQERAARAAQRAMAEPAAQPVGESILSLGFCPTQPPEAFGSWLFTERFAQTVSEIVGRMLQIDPGLAYAVRVEPLQDCLYAYPASFETYSSWTAAAYVDGSFSAVFTTPVGELHHRDLDVRVAQGWRALVALAGAAGASGSARLTVSVRGEHSAIVGLKRGFPSRPIGRWTDTQPPTPDELASVHRELHRGFGEMEWDPDPAASGSQDHPR